jgi:alpha-tubulin suppressor-like RCC1 family protein
VPVEGLENGVTAVSVGLDFSCALTTAGGVKCWGRNEHGQLGDGTTTTRRTPVDVSGLTTGVAALDAGRLHSCALTTAGGVKCWGYNSDGQLGDGTTTERLVPTGVVGLATAGVAAIATSYNHTCALTTAGGLRCWGFNFSGQLGDGTQTNSSTPVWVSGLTAGVASVAAGSDNTCAVTVSGGLKCWGFNGYLQLGFPGPDQPTPVDRPGLTTGVSSAGIGPGVICALKVDGRMVCWGSNNYNALGEPSVEAPTTALVAPRGVAAGVIAMAVANEETCAITARGGAFCWGRQYAHQLGDESSFPTTAAVPTPLFGTVNGAATLAAGESHACRVTPTGGVQCWGGNYAGQLGDGSTSDRLTAVDVQGLASGVAAVVAGASHSCALTLAGGVKCWGRNGEGQMGDGTTTTRTTPVDVDGLTSGVVALSAGSYFTCALTAAGGVKCWGFNYDGQLGDTTTASRALPVWVAGLTSGARSISAGNTHACAVTTAGGLVCWGRNLSGQLGDGTTTSRSTRAAVTGLTAGVLEAAAGGTHTCALTSNTAGAGVKCWGSNGSGQVGDGTNTTRLSPVDVSGLTTGALTIRAGESFSCAATTQGTLMCWGENASGQLGDGSTLDRTTPVTVANLTAIGEVEAGNAMTLTVNAAGGAVAWGRNSSGQLGDGTRIDRGIPKSVRAFKLEDDFDGDGKSDVAVYRPSTGTWFSLNSSKGNASYQALGWGLQAQGDMPAPGDYDGDGIVDPTVFRPGTGTWFILESHASYTTWRYFGWGATGDIPVPADYDGDGMTDGAVYRPSNGTWYIRPSGGGTEWSVAFGNATDVPIPGHFDGDGRIDIAVYRPATGTWFVLTSSSNYTTYWYKGWGIQAQGDTPAPGDYDGDGKLDLCVFRASTGTWFVLESHANLTTWNWFGWGANGDVVVPSDFDGDGITDAAIYRPSTGTWYVRPSGGGAQWNVVFGQSGDVPLLKVR